MGRYSQKLIERRHQDMRDQAAEVIESSKKFEGFLRIYELILRFLQKNE